MRKYTKASANAKKRVMASDGIFVSLANKAKKTFRPVTASSLYTDYTTLTHGTQRYHVHLADADTPDFIAQVSKIAAYDDADYVWAKILADKTVKFVRDTKVVGKMQLPEYNEDEYESIDEYVGDCLDIVALELAEYNKSISPRMMYD